jgi:protein YIPF1/2
MMFFIGKFDLIFFQLYITTTTSIFIINRIIGSMTPTFNQSFLINKIRPNPDLYGPFWICISLIFTIAIAGNIVSFLHNFGSDYKWHTDFHKGYYKYSISTLFLIKLLRKLAIN